MPRLIVYLMPALLAGGCFADLRRDPPDTKLDAAAADGAAPTGACPPGQFRCGTRCHACCAAPDCPAMANAEANCESDRVCSYRCRADFERCRGSCQPYPKVLGVCLAAAGTVTAEVYWCDSDEAGERLLKWKFNVRQVMELALDPADPDVLDKVCLASSNGMLGTYCTSGPFVSGRVSRMDTAFIYTGTLDSDGKLASYHRTPGTGSRTCEP